MLKKTTRVLLLKHPYIQELLTVLRDKNTPCHVFRNYLEEMGIFIAYEISRDLDFEEITVKTPLGVASGFRLRDPVVLIGILRAALPMVYGMLRVFKKAQIGVVAARRIEEAGSRNNDFMVEIPYEREPDLNDKVVIIADPMIATASTIVRIISRIKGRWQPKKIIVAAIIGSKFGVERLIKEHPDVLLYITAVDEKLNEHGYIVPGLGDAGDRAFCTE